jgi:hypothetical protein
MIEGAPSVDLRRGDTMAIRTQGLAGTDPVREAIVYDAAAGMFVRVTVDAAGRILARSDLDPSEKRATLRRLFATRTTRVQQDAFVRAIDRLGLLVVLAPRADDARPVTTDEMSDAFCEAFSRYEVEAFAEKVESSIQAFLLLTWAVNFSVAAEGQPLPRLECVDPDLPYLAPFGVPCPPPNFDARLALQEIECASEIPVEFAIR